MKQLKECSCGTFTQDARCPDCMSPTFPIWTVHTDSGEYVGYVLGFDETDARESIRQSPCFDGYSNPQPRPCHSSPEVGPIPEA